MPPPRPRAVTPTLVTLWHKGWGSLAQVAGRQRGSLVSKCSKRLRARRVRKHRLAPAKKAANTVAKHSCDRSSRLVGRDLVERAIAYDGLTQAIPASGPARANPIPCAKVAQGWLTPVADGGMTHVAVLPGDGIGPEVSAEAFGCSTRSGSAIRSTRSAGTQFSRRAIPSRPRRSRPAARPTPSCSPRSGSPSSRASPFGPSKGCSGSARSSASTRTCDLPALRAST